MIEFRFHCGIGRFLVLVIKFTDPHREQLSHTGIDSAKIDPQILLLTF